MKTKLAMTIMILALAVSAEASFFSKIIPSFGSHNKHNHHNSGGGPAAFDFTPFMLPPPGPSVVDERVSFITLPIADLGPYLNPPVPGADNPVPEPATILLVAIGLALLAAINVGREFWDAIKRGAQ